jgi:transposase
MSHHGLVAAIEKKLKIEEKVDVRLPIQSREDNLTRGPCVMAMILNGLGFVERRLYLVSDFFKNKPVEKLLGPGVRPEQINDDVLGRTLDAISAYGVTRFFSEIAFEIGLEHKAIDRYAHLDTTSISVEGDYSKDHRPDLKQLVLSLTTSGNSAFPIWLEVLSGNSSDKANLIKTLESCEVFQKELKKTDAFVDVADSALYSKEKLLSKKNEILWISRVPETVMEAKEWVQKNKNELSWISLEKRYSMSAQKSNDGEVEQRWIVIFSEQADQKEIKTANQVLVKKEELLKKEIKKVQAKIFDCQKDGEHYLNDFSRKHPFFQISFVFQEKQLPKKGRGKSRTEDSKKIGYTLVLSYTIRTEEKEALLNQCGKFILATHDLDEVRLPNEQILKHYKDQSKTEGSFRFLKSPSFFAGEIYLKKEGRIQALMAIMGFTLMIYNVGHFH